VSFFNLCGDFLVGVYHALAVRTGPATPVVTLEPTNQCQIAGGNVSFTARGAGLYGVTYQWHTNSVNITGATNATLNLTNVQAAQEAGIYAGTQNIIPVPEPGAFSLAAIGALLLGSRRWRNYLR
jgi:PEP-CTERM motif-containing protein